MGWDKSRGDKHGHLRLALQVNQLIRHKSEHIIAFLWKFNEDGLTEGTSLCGREGIGQLLGGGINILNDGDRREEAVSPADQLSAQDIGGNQPDQIEQEEEADEPDPWEMVQAMEKRDIDIRNQGVKDAIQGVEDKLEDEKGNPDGQDD